MNLEAVRAIAKSHGITPSKLSKANLIRSIQVREGNFDCFASARVSECDQTGCLWRNDCLATIPKGELS